MLPGLVKGLDDIVGKRALLEVQEVLLQVRDAARADEYLISVLALEERVVGEPAEGDLGRLIRRG